MSYAQLPEPPPVVPPLPLPSHDAHVPPELTPRSLLAVARSVAELEAHAAATKIEADAAHDALRTARANADQASAAAAEATKTAAVTNAPEAVQAARACTEQADSARATAQAAGREAQLAARKAAVEASVVAASAGRYVLVAPGRSRAMEAFSTVDEARALADSLWRPWVLYCEQRGSFTEVGCGGVGLPFVHASIRKKVGEMMRNELNTIMATPRANPYGQNY